MNKTCARCEKTVYPTEELKCLDKVWHKGCFKCHECGMTLNMRTYKGFNKIPYCEAHIPKAKATTMAETPELKRIAENTKIQSNAKYHAEFEKSKGKFTQVADDPETLRIKANSKIISNVAYHGDLEKKAAMEQKRTINENGEYIDVPDDNNVNANHKGPTSAPPASSYPTPTPQHQQPQHQQPQHQQSQHQQSQHQQSQHQQPQQQQPPQQQSQQAQQPQKLHQHPYVLPAVAPSAIGKISEYDPMNEQPRNSPYSARQNQTVIYTSDRGAVTQPPTRKIGSIADIDPINNVYGSLSNPEYQHQQRTNPNHNQYHQQTQQQHLVQQQQQHQHQMHQNHGGVHPPQQMHNPVAPPPQPNALSARVYRAMYDYDAQDSDEVSFCEGDLIVNVTNIDGGWMTGSVKRTGDTGMLPANYVEVAHI